MPQFEFQRRVPFARADVFDIVADIESYPQFVPGCRAARILCRDGNRLRVEQELGLATWSWRFCTDAVLERPSRIAIATREAPFAHLDQVWQFRAANRGGTDVSLRVDYELRSRFLGHLATRLFDEGLRRTSRAFEQRIRQRLGEPRDRA